MFDVIFSPCLVSSSSLRLCMLPRSAAHIDCLTNGAWARSSLGESAENSMRSNCEIEALTSISSVVLQQNCTCLMLHAHLSDTLGLSHGDHLPTTARSNIHTPIEAGGRWHLVFHCRSSPLKKHVPIIRFLWLYFCAATALPWDFCSFNYNLHILATHCLLTWRVNKYVEIEIKYAT